MSDERVSENRLAQPDRSEFDGRLYSLGAYWLHLQAAARALDAERCELLRARRLGLPRDEGLREAREARMQVLSSHLADPMLDQGFRARAEQHRRTRKGLRVVRGEEPLWHDQAGDQPGRYLEDLLEHLAGWLTRSDLEELREKVDSLIDEAADRGEKGRVVEEDEEEVEVDEEARLRKEREEHERELEAARRDVADRQLELKEAEAWLAELEAANP
jgi:hypothetical protein